MSLRSDNGSILSTDCMSMGDGPTASVMGGVIGEVPPRPVELRRAPGDETEPAADPNHANDAAASDIVKEGLSSGETTEGGLSDIVKDALAPGETTD
jgi:hypothetical protein